MSQLPTFAPPANLETQPFWDAIDEGRFLLPRCSNDSCGLVIWYPRTLCPECGTFGVDWFEASGQGTVYTYTIVHKGRGPWAEHTPYVTAYVELDEGPRIMTNIVDVDPAAIEVGARVEVTYDDAGDGRKLYRFRPAVG